jgi:hypothetical protein
MEEIVSEQHTHKSEHSQSFLCDDDHMKPGMVIETDDGEIGVIESYDNLTLKGIASFAGASAPFHCGEIYRVYNSLDEVPPSPPLPTEFLEIDL